jgi:uncharacterized protein YndB with AHSA1/START domain
MSTELPDKYVLHVQKDIDIDAPPQAAFAALLEEMGPGFQTPDGHSMGLKLESWPGGRWYRDLGGEAGHLWGHVQVIKPPLLLELTGPMFMSYPVASHVQYRLTEKGKGTRLTLIHRAIGMIAAEHREGVNKGWQNILERVKARATKEVKA